MQTFPLHAPRTILSESGYNENGSAGACLCICLSLFRAFCASGDAVAGCFQLKGGGASRCSAGKSPYKFFGGRKAT